MRWRRVRTAAAYVILGGLASTASGAYLESGDDADVIRDTPVPARPIRVIPPEPPPGHENPVTRLVRQIRVGRPYVTANLTVFPLSVRNSASLPEVRTLEQALDNGWIVIREKRHAQVPVVAMRNDSRYHVLVLGGEVLCGGRQNRAARTDVLLPPRSPFIDIPVYCVEEGRWRGVHDEFGAAPGMVHPTLRLDAAIGASQTSIWRSITDRGRNLGLDTPTADYQGLLAEQSVRTRMTKISVPFLRLPGRDRIGAVAVVGGHVLGCDLFADERLFAELWPALLRSYTFDCMTRPAGKHHALNRHDIQRYLERVLSARFVPQPTPGVGRALQLGHTVTGTALLWRRRVVHLALSGAGYSIPLPLAR